MFSCPPRDGGPATQIITSAALMIIVDAAARVRTSDSGALSLPDQSPLFRTLTGYTTSRTRVRAGTPFGVPVTFDDLTSEFMTDSILPDLMFTEARRELVLYVEARNFSSAYVPFVASGKTFEKTGRHMWRFLRPANGATFNFTENDRNDALAFVTEFIDEAKLTDEAQIMKEARARHPVIPYFLPANIAPEIWKTAGWFADAHYANQEFAIYRDTAMVYWSSMLPPSDLRDPKKAVEPSMFLPKFYQVWPFESIEGQRDPDAFGVEVRLGRVQFDKQDEMEICWKRNPIEPTEGYFPVDSWKLAKVRVGARAVRPDARTYADQELTPFGEEDGQPSESDVLFTSPKQLPTFGGVLSTEEAFRLASLMTTRQLRVPLILHFFSSRPAVLVHNALQRLLTGILFEPSHFEANPYEFGSESVMCSGDAFEVTSNLGPLGIIPVPPSNRHHLATAGGLLNRELVLAPAPVLTPFLNIIERIKERTWERYCDHHSPYFVAATWAIVCGARVEGHLRLAIDEMMKNNVDESDPASPLAQARDFLKRLRDIMVVSATSFHALLTHMLTKVGSDVCAATSIHGYLILTRAFADEDEMGGGLSEDRDADSPVESNALITTGHASIFSSASFVNFYLRAVSAELTRLGVTMEKLPIPTVFNDGDAGIMAIEKPRAALLSVPWHDVFTAVVRHREQLITWLGRLERFKTCLINGHVSDSSALDVVLSHVLMITRRRPKCELLRWESESESGGKRTCVRWVESPHPYPNSTEVYTRISFPGASHLTITFDPLSCTEAKHKKLADMLQIFHDETLSREWVRFSGSVGWAGVQNEAPLIIPADSIVLKFQSDESVNDFGFKMKIVAPINEELVKKIYGQYTSTGWVEIVEKASVDGIFRDDLRLRSFELTYRLIERAVAEAWNHEVGACAWLVRHVIEPKEGEDSTDDTKGLDNSNFGMYHTGRCDI